MLKTRRFVAYGLRLEQRTPKEEKLIAGASEAGGEGLNIVWHRHCGELDLTSDPLFGRRLFSLRAEARKSR